ncbi:MULTISPECIES: histidine phosphatase family protein [unclassified Jeotgalibaca]|uniref:histidine phosphatase family protein n=1 Tax=unclassified Jeotgalibaca TaxID=2621505 RepID=UPI003FD2E3F0
MQQLYFVRHGQTKLNAANHVQGGAIDSPLLEKSIEDARKTGKFLCQTSISRAISSPQIRAWDTAKYILDEFKSDIPLEKDDLLKEFGYGKWEGLYIPSIAEKHPEIFYHLRHEPHLYNPSLFGGETYQDLIARGTKSILFHAEKQPQSDLLFVGHSILWTATLLSLVGFELKDIRSQSPLANTSITRLIKDNEGFHLDMWNFTDHLV